MCKDKRPTKIVVIICVAVLIVAIILIGTFVKWAPKYIELEVWPRSDEQYNIEQPVIQFKPHDPGSWDVWYRRINEFLKPYETSIPENPSRAPCSTHNRLELQSRSESCDRTMRLWIPCTADQYYGYPAGKPCVFLRLSHINNWAPHPYNSTSLLPLPSDLPHYLRHIIMQRPAYRYGDFVWMSCQGEFSADQENIGPIQYIPAKLPPGFPMSRLHTADRNLSDQIPGPVMAVMFENPRRGVLINVECRIWTRDLDKDPLSGEGRAYFAIYID